MGSVMPLLAVAEKLKEIRPNAEFLFLGTKTGPEKKVVEKYQIPFKAITGGKFRRYFNFHIFFDPWLVFFGFIQSFFIIKKFQPKVVISAGSYISVPVVWAAWLLRKPSIIHQEDIQPGLANLLMSRFASLITVTLEKSLKDFPAKKTVLTGNPYRPEILTGDKNKAISELGLKDNLPIILIGGGGVGALELNKIVVDALPELTKFCQIVHLTGRGKMLAVGNRENYYPHEFLTEGIKDILAAAEIVVTRAGFSSLTELAILGKPAIIIPLPATHQEDNARFFSKNNAALVVQQKDLTPEILITAIKELLDNPAKRLELSRNIVKMMSKDATEKFVEQILKII